MKCSLSHFFSKSFPNFALVGHFEKEPRAKCARGFELDGAGDRNRTGDPVITSDVLYQLSYTSSRCVVPRHRAAGFPKEKDGATPQNRTGDTVIFSHVLYQLS